MLWENNSDENSKHSASLELPPLTWSFVLVNFSHSFSYMRQVMWSCDQASQEKNLQEVMPPSTAGGNRCADFPEVRWAECGPELLLRREQ